MATDLEKPQRSYTGVILLAGLIGIPMLAAHWADKKRAPRGGRRGFDGLGQVIGGNLGWALPVTGAALGLLYLLMRKKEEPIVSSAQLLSLTGGAKSFLAVDAATGLSVSESGKLIHGHRPYTQNLETTDIWQAPVGPIRSPVGGRSPELLAQVIAQFDVAQNPRYTPRDIDLNLKKDTFCNIFVQDVMRAMGYELPWGNANNLSAWFAKFGGTYGWQQVSAAGAVSAASQGRPAIAAALNPGGTGHVAVVRPGQATTIAQAGATNFASGPIASGFGVLMPRVLYYVNS